MGKYSVALTKIKSNYSVATKKVNPASAHLRLFFFFTSALVVLRVTSDSIIVAAVEFINIVETFLRPTVQFPSL